VKGVLAAQRPHHSEHSSEAQGTREFAVNSESSPSTDREAGVARVQFPAMFRTVLRVRTVT
jgi:hypothetical protein